MHVRARAGNETANQVTLTDIRLVRAD